MKEEDTSIYVLSIYESLIPEDILVFRNKNLLVTYLNDLFEDKYLMDQLLESDYLQVKGCEYRVIATGFIE